MPDVLPCGHADRREKYGEKRCRTCYDIALYARSKRLREQRRIYMQNYNRRRKANGGPLSTLAASERGKARVFKLRGGLSIEEYDKLLAAQAGVCAICKKPPGKRRFCVDHDHKTGIVRGLLCFTCNYGLGWFRDDKTRLRRAADYLDERSDAAMEVSQVA